MSGMALAQSPGEKIYEEYCAGCHGTTSRMGMASTLFDDKWNHGGSREDIIRNTKKGIVDMGMPAYEGTLSDEQIAQLIGYMDEQRAEGVELKPAEVEKIETEHYTLHGETLSTDVEIPWAISFADEHTALITERPGGLKWMIREFVQPDPIKGTPEVLHEGQGGLMDVAFHPDYKENGWIYLSYSHQLNPGERPAMTRVVRGRIKDHTWVDQEVIWEAKPEHYRNARHHYGSRIVFDPEGYLYFCIGDRGAKNQAQEITVPNGKVHRIWPDGRIPEDNPFVDEPDAVPSIYTYGNRNPQGLAIHPVTGDVWETEHGPKGGDELNIIKKGVNYGWPVITYGINYNGTPITDITHKEGMAQPVVHWTPSLAVCGMDFYTGEMFPKWENDLFVTSLAKQEMRRVTIDGEEVTNQETVLKGAGRIRDVAVGADGALYLAMNGPDRILKLVPAE